METVIYAVSVLTGVGAAAAVLLIIADRFMHVKSDTRTEELRSVLPGANCGGCGYAGCDDYASAVASGKAEIGLCVPGGDAASVAMSRIMGISGPATDVEEKVAVVRCRGTLGNTLNKYDYKGVESCAAASMMFSGNSACIYGCLGLGDCSRACMFDAIKVVDGAAVVDQDKCTGCGMCAKVCPKQIIDVLPLGRRAVVQCRNHDKGAALRKYCKVGCLGCGLCEKACKFGAVKVTDGLAFVDTEKCKACGACIRACPTGAIGMIVNEQNILS
ncbi:MAG: RnfABCDGE type electron transport complex subunit B [Oscillospiraceae bacterium]|jgi:electron transport complex protein RnfB